MLRKSSRLAIVWCALVCLLAAQPAQRADVKSVAAAGHVSGKEYANSYFGVTVQLPQPNTELLLNDLVAEDRAILLRVMNAKAGDQQYAFAIIAHSDDIAGLESTSQFVRSVRHSFEREGYETLVAEARVVIGGHEFIQSNLKMKDKDYWKSVLCTRTKGYLFGFWMESPTKQQIEKLTDLAGRVKFKD